MHNLDNDGFAILAYEPIGDGTFPVLLFSGSYRKCLGFIKTAKAIVFHADLIFCNSAKAKEYLLKGGGK